MTDRHLILAFTNPVPGREDDYNDWYDAVHLRETVGLPGVVWGERYELAPDQPIPSRAQRYLAVYAVEGELAPIVSALRSQLEPGVTVDPAVLDLTSGALRIYTARGARVECSDRDPHHA